MKTAQSQQSTIGSDIVASMNHELHKHNYRHYLSGCSNEMDIIATTFFVSYKNFISSQDSRSCTFEPSCSVYALETIKRNGAVKGFLDTIDRLTRCNGLSPENYEKDIENHLLKDMP